MPLVQAFAMVRENLDDAAVCDPFIPAAGHSNDLVPQRRKPGDLVVDVGQMRGRDLVRRRARPCWIIGKVQ